MLSCFMYYYYEVFSCQLFPKGFLEKRIMKFYLNRKLNWTALKAMFI